MKYRIFYLIILLLLPFGAGAQEWSASPDTLGTRVYFRQGVSALDLQFRGNADALDRFVRSVEGMLGDPRLTVHAVTVSTGASPEGGVEYNDRLAEARAASVKRYLVEALPLAPYQIRTESVGADWEGLWHLVRKSDCPWRDAVMGIISETNVRLDPSTANKRLCQERMKALDGGRAWAWMLQNLFPDLRAGAGTLRTIVSRPLASGGRDTIVVIHEYEGPDTDWLLGVVVDRAAEAATRNVLAALEERNRPKGYARDSLFRVPIMAVRTNLLAPLLNVGVEVPLSNRWSVSADWYWPWVWRPWMNRVYPAQARCAQALGGSVEGRLWLGKTHQKGDEWRKYRLRGHSLGLMAGAGYYDIQPEWKGVQGEYFFVGLDYMYALPLGKGGAHLEFDIAVGYANTGWRGYEVHEEGGRLFGNYDDGSWQGAVPVRAGFNLVIPIFEKTRTVKTMED